MQIQTTLNSDIVMQFDECTPYEPKTKGQITTEDEARVSMEMSLRWANAARPNLPGWRTPTRCSASCRAACSRTCARSRWSALVEMDFPGYAVGGVSVGEPKDEMLRIMAHTPHRLPAHKPRYLMGVGTPEDLVDGVAAGRGHVRLRHADPQRAQRHVVHPLWRPENPQRPPQERPAPAGRTCTCYACAGSDGVP